MRNNPNTRLFLCNIPHKESKEFDSWITEVGQSLLTEASPIKNFIVGQAWGLESGSAREDNEFKVRMLSKKIKELTN